MLVTIRDTKSDQATDNNRTMEDCVCLLNYAAKHIDDTIWYKSSDIILQVHSNALYLLVSKAHK